jgi:hypothetical protein
MYVVCFDSSSAIFSRFVLVYVLDLPIKIHNNYIMPVSLTTTTRTELEISRATKDAIRGRRQRSLLRPDDERSIYVYTLSSSIMTILSLSRALGLLERQKRQHRSTYILSHIKDIKQYTKT